MNLVKSASQEKLVLDILISCVVSIKSSVSKTKSEGKKGIEPCPYIDLEMHKNDILKYSTEYFLPLLIVYWKKKKNLLVLKEYRQTW